MALGTRPRARAFESRCLLHRKRKLRRRVNGCETLRRFFQRKFSIFYTELVKSGDAKHCKAFACAARLPSGDDV
jgi:hypothetical protein